jgi:alkylation response protein AidB-like acyl-CoA dehydrogenase
MDLSLTETQVLLKASVERFVRERHSFEARKRVLTSSDAAAETWHGIAELGILGIGIDEQYGGSGGGFEEIAIVMEAFGRGLVCVPYLPTVTAALMIGETGGEDAKAHILPAVAEGRMKLALAHDETGARYELASVGMRADRVGDGFRLNGQKIGVLGGGDAAALIVSARTSGSVDDSNGVSLFLVRPEEQGVSLRAFSNFDEAGAADITFDNAKVSSTDLIGEEGAALSLIEHARDRAITALCWDAVGAMTALNELTLDYIKVRSQFGRPIGKFQVLQHRMVDMTIAAEQARSMAILATDRASWSDGAARGKDISAAKVAVGKAARAVGQGAVQLHGGMGLTMEYAASHYFKRLTAFELLFGDTAYHLARFAA